MQGSTPARLYCLLVGGVLVVAGVLGFFYETSFNVGDDVVADDLLGILAVNGWHNLVHLATGAILLAAAGGAARSAALGIGALYVVVAILGFIATGDGGIGFIAEDDVLIDLVPVNNEDNVLHAILGVTGVLAGYASPRAVAAPA